MARARAGIAFVALGALATAAAGPAFSTPEQPTWVAPLRKAVQECGTQGAEDIFLGDFVRSNGVRLRGLGVVRPVKKGERFYCEPHACLLSNTTEDFVSWRRGRPLTDKACTSRQRMSLFMAEKRRDESSLWALVLKSFVGEDQLRQYHPAYLPEGLLPAKANAYWVHKAARLRTCHEAYARDAGSSAVSFDDAYFHEVIAEVYIDTYALVPGGPKMLLSMPFANICNAGRKEQININEVEVEGGDGGRLDCWVAARDLKAGEEVVCNYNYIGASEAELFRNMGFFLHSGDERDANHRDQISDYEMFGADFSTREEDEVDDDPEYGACEGLGPEEFQQPAPDAHPILHNFWRFAEAHCRDRGNDDEDEDDGGSYHDSHGDDDDDEEAEL